MASKLKKDTQPDDATKQHNAKDRKKVIKEVIREIATLTAQRKAISEQIASIKAEKIKGVLGMKISDWNAAYRLSLLEGDDRDEFFDTLRETFEALGFGGQLNFLEAMEKADEAPAPGAYEAGRQARAEGKGIDACPYLGEINKRLRAEWERGWDEAAPAPKAA